MKIFPFFLALMLCSRFAAALGIGISPAAIGSENIKGQIVLYNPDTSPAEISIEHDEKIISIEKKTIVPANSVKKLIYELVPGFKDSEIIISIESSGIKLSYPIQIKQKEGTLLNSVIPVIKGKKSKENISVYFGITIILGILASGGAIFYYLMHNRTSH